MPITYRSPQGDSAVPDVLACAAPGIGGASALVVTADDHTGIVVADSSGTHLSSLDDVVSALGRKPAWRRPVIGHAPVEAREATVARGVAQGSTTEEMAAQLGVSARTVTTVRRRLRDRSTPDVASGSRGVSVIGTQGLTRDVVRVALASVRDDVDEAGVVHVDDRARVLVMATTRDFLVVGAARCVVVGALPPGMTVRDAVGHGMVAQLPITVGVDELSLAVDAAMAGQASLSADTVQCLVDEVYGVHVQPAALSERDVDIVQGIRAGESVKQTARRLGVSPKTVENGRHRLYQRFGVHSAPELDAAIGTL